MRNFEANVNPSHRDYGRKANAFFKYAAHDEYMVSVAPPSRNTSNTSKVPEPKCVRATSRQRSTHRVLQRRRALCR